MPETPEDLLQSLVERPPYTYPREVLVEMISRLDEMVPHLLADLERIGANPEVFDEDRDGLRLVFAAFLLAQAREVRAFQPLVSLLSLPGNQIDELWGDLSLRVGQEVQEVLRMILRGRDQISNSVSVGERKSKERPMAMSPAPTLIPRLS